MRVLPTLNPHRPGSYPSNAKLRFTALCWKTLSFWTLSVALLNAPCVFAQAPSGAAVSWNAATPHPTAVGYYGFAQDGENMYIIGGGTAPSTDTAAVRRYNARTNVWTSLADMPTAEGESVATFYQGKIYVFTVAKGDGGRFYIYDVASNTWSQGASRPGPPNFGAAVGAFNGKVYVAGGGFGGGTTDLSIYDLATNTWSTGPVAPSPIQNPGSAQIGQFLYVIGGYIAKPENSNVSMRFDMATNAWSVGPVFNPKRAQLGLAAAGTKLFAMGGENDGVGGYDTSAAVHELETSTWPAGGWFFSPDNLPSPRMAMKAGFFSTGRAGGEIWSTGGQTADAHVRLNENLFRPVNVPCQDYNVTESTRTLVPATNDTGNHCNDCLTGTVIPFPFPIRFYGTTYGSARASSNGNLQFNSANVTGTHTNLPATGFNATIFPYWDNTRTDLAGGGIFTSTTGAAPNRTFNIEWRVSNNTGAGTANYEIRFFEGSDDFEILYGVANGTFTGTIGVQRDSNPGTLFDQVAGPSAPFPAEGTRLLFSTGCCAPIAFNGAIGSNSLGYPGGSGLQTGRVLRDDIQSRCGTSKGYPGTTGTTQRTYDRYSFHNPGPATCVTFDLNTACADTQNIYPVAYLGSFNPANIATNYLGDPGSIPTDGFTSFSVNVPANSTVVLVVHEVTAGGGCPSYDVVVRGLSCPPALTNAVSRKVHGFRGEFDIPLPPSGLGVECRDSSGGNHDLVFTLNSEVSSGNVAVTTGVGTVGTPTFLGKTMMVPLSGVPDLQKLTLTLSGVTNALGQTLPNTNVTMNVLLGDTTGNKTVNSSDLGQTKANSGVPVTEANFRNDTTTSGAISASDIGQVKANAGHTLP